MDSISFWLLSHVIFLTLISICIELHLYYTYTIYTYTIFEFFNCILFRFDSYDAISFILSSYKIRIHTIEWKEGHIVYER